jgi:hypothetical protein
MSAAAPARPRLLRRPVSEAQREAARRNGANSRGPRTPAGKARSSRNARRHGLYAQVHLFTPAESEALCEETRDWIKSFRPAGPEALAVVRQLALATYQVRRIDEHVAGFAARNPRDVLALARLLGALGAIEHRYRRLRLRCINRLDQPATENEANEPGNLWKTNEEMASIRVAFRDLFPRVAPLSPAQEPPVLPSHILLERR